MKKITFLLSALFFTLMSGVVLASIGFRPPNISNIVTAPSDGITSSTTVAVSAMVKDLNSDLSTVTLYWGTASDALNTPINMSALVDTFSTETDIPAQVNGTTVYYSIVAIDASSLSTTSDTLSYMVEDPITIFSISDYEAFPTGWSGTAQAGSYFKLAPGYFQTAALDLTGYIDITLTFDVATFGSGTANPLEVTVSNDGGATWTAHSFTSNTPTSSTYVDGGTFSLTNVSISTMIKFECTTDNKGIRLKNILLTAYVDPSAPVKPTIEDMNPASGLEFEVGVAIPLSATVKTEDVGGLDSVVLAYGYATDALNDSITVQMDVDTAYTSMYLYQTGSAYGQLIAYGVNGTVAKSSISELIGVCGTVESPVASAASDISESSFTANWSASTAAEGYILDVWKTTAATVEASDLFISAYVEGSSDNKYIAIYNGTGASVDLSSYSIAVYMNGAEDSTSVSALSGTLANNETLVLANSEADIYEGETMSYSALGFNGDDVFVLLKSSVILDAAGPMGNANNNNFAKDKSLYRKSTISSPSTTYSVGDWDEYDKDYITDLGSHSMDGAAFDTYILENDTVSTTSASVTGLVEGSTYHYAVNAYNIYGCESDVSNVISVTTGTATALDDVVSPLQVFTNEGQIIVRSTKQVSLQVYDISGRKVAMQLVNGNATIAVKSGIYIVKANETITKVVVK